MSISESLLLKTKVILLGEAGERYILALFCKQVVQQLAFIQLLDIVSFIIIGLHCQSHPLAQKLYSTSD